MRTGQTPLDALRRPTAASAFVALLIATAVVVTQSDHGFRDVGMGIWWYEYYPFYEYSHGDFVQSPPMLPIYGNLVLVTAFVYVPVRIAESALPGERREGPIHLNPSTAGVLLVLVLVLGIVPLSGDLSVLSVLTVLATVALRGIGLGAVVDVAEWGIGAGSVTPAAALVLCCLYGVVSGCRRARTALGGITVASSES